jgi:hypothetical protein
MHQHIHILYTDGHEVTVTDSFFQVKKALYQLKGITNHGLRVIHPDRLFPFLTLLLGAMLITMGALHLIPTSTIPNINFESIEMTGNAFVLGLGIALFVVGGLMFSFMKPRFAIRIATAEGEKNVLVSRKREYIAQVVDALNKAFLNIVAPKHQKTKWGIRKR